MSEQRELLYKNIRDTIVEQIRSGKLRYGDKIPTQFELMDQFHVSRITVTKALDELKREGYVVSYPSKGTFVTEGPMVSEETLPHANSSLVRDANAPVQVASVDKDLPHIAILLPSMEDFFSLNLVNGVLSVIPYDKYTSSVYITHDPMTENYLLKRILSVGTAGVVLFPQDQPYYSSELLAMKLNNYPLVLIDRYLPRLDTSYVIEDNDMAGALCMDHLYELGHRRVALLSSQTNTPFTVKHRHAGILSEAARLGLEESSVAFVSGCEALSDAEFMQSVEHLVNDEEITALISSQQELSVRLYEALTSLGLRVPQDVSLLSFDRPSPTVSAPDFFTYIDQSERLIGREAGTLLRKRIEESDTTVYHRIITPQLIVRSSTGRAPV